MEPVVGVLALQGAFARHVETICSLGAQAIEVRKPADLDLCDGLIIPGGESTTMIKQMHFIEMLGPFKEFACKKPVFGTCAGVILMSHEIIGDTRVPPFDLIDMSVERNAFGRQVESFSTDIEAFLGSKKPVKLSAIFIRAPRIKRVGKDVNVLASYEGEPVLVQQGLHLGATFHPELSGDAAIHGYFLQQLRRR